jgi:hypothetical protein
VINISLFIYGICDVLITRTECVKDLLVMLDRKLYYHEYISHISSEALQNFGPIHFIKGTFSSMDSFKVLYVATIRRKLQYASVACLFVANHK